MTTILQSILFFDRTIQSIYLLHMLHHTVLLNILFMSTRVNLVHYFVSHQRSTGHIYSIPNSTYQKRVITVGTLGKTGMKFITANTDNVRDLSISIRYASGVDELCTIQMIHHGKKQLLSVNVKASLKVETINCQLLILLVETIRFFKIYIHSQQKSLFYSCVAPYST